VHEPFGLCARDEAGIHKMFELRLDVATGRPKLGRHVLRESSAQPVMQPKNHFDLRA
jgi:hypothetical protein